MYGVYRIAGLIAVTPLLLTFAMAATTVTHFIDNDAKGTATTSGSSYHHAVAVSPATTVAPLSARSAKALHAPSSNMATSSRMWQNGGEWRMVPSRLSSWDADSRIPMNQESANSISRIGRVDLENEVEEGREKNKYYKKYKKYMLPLLLAYKLKFFTLVPILIGGLVLLTGATGLAGFFFALFAATMGLKGGGEH